MILPFVEQAALYSTIDLNLPVWGQAVVSTNVAAFRCPSDQRETVDQTSNIAVTNYPGSEGYHWHPTANVGNAAPWNSFGDPFTGGGPIRTCGSGLRRTGTPVFHSAFVGTAYAGWGGNETGANTVNPDGSAKTSGTWFRNHSFTPTYLAAWGPNASWHGPSSYHPGGIHVGLVDGAVDFVTENIDYGTWAKLNAMADRHAIQSSR